jgi:hypothetical protein
MAFTALGDRERAWGLFRCSPALGRDVQTYKVELHCRRRLRESAARRARRMDLVHGLAGWMLRFL